MAILLKGKTFVTGEQVTAGKLNNLVDLAKIDVDMVDNSTLTFNTSTGTALRIKDDGVKPQHVDETGNYQVDKLKVGIHGNGKLHVAQAGATNPEPTIPSGHEYAGIVQQNSNATDKHGLLVASAWQASGSKILEVSSVDATTGDLTERFTVKGDGSVSISGSLSVSGGISSPPPGAVIAFARPTLTAPSGWLVADGSAVSRTTYAALFAIVSTTFGNGDGSTTFNLPDLRGYFIRGVGENTDVGKLAIYSPNPRGLVSGTKPRL